MARYTGSVCRICRRENLKLFLKGDRCYGDKCAFDRRSYAPGEHGQRRRGKISDYGIQLREKQKVKKMYGLSEKQFRLVFQQHPKSEFRFRAGFRRADLFYELGKYAAAIDLYKALLSQKPAADIAAPAWFFLGEAHARAGDRTRARAALEKVLELVPRTHEFHARARERLARL